MNGELTQLLGFRRQHLVLLENAAKGLATTPDASVLNKLALISKILDDLESVEAKIVASKPHTSFAE